MPAHPIDFEKDPDHPASDEEIEKMMRDGRLRIIFDRTVARKVRPVWIQVRSRAHDMNLSDTKSDGFEEWSFAMSAAFLANHCIEKVNERGEVEMWVSPHGMRLAFKHADRVVKRLRDDLKSGLKGVPEGQVIIFRDDEKDRNEGP